MFNLWHNRQEEFEDTKGVIRIRIDNTMIHKTQTYKPKTEQHEPHQKLRGERRCSGRVSSSTCVKCNNFSPLVGIYSNENIIKLTDFIVLLNMLYIVGFTQWHSLSNHHIRYCFVINSISGSYGTVVVTLK